jgi:galactitol-specific phosphotransferase system IIB component
MSAEPAKELSPDAELTKDQRVEAARKKFEELKKKKKKKSKKAKGEVAEAGEAGEAGEDATEVAAEDAAEEAADAVVESEKISETGETVEEGAKENTKERTEDDTEIAKNDSETSKYDAKIPKDDTADGLEKVDKDTVVPTQEIKDPEESKNSTNADAPASKPPGKYIPERSQVSHSPPTDKEIYECALAEARKIEADSAEQISAVDVPEIIGESLKDPQFGTVSPRSADVSSFSTPAPSDDVTTLKATIELQKNTIKKLRNENTDLKLAKMDLNDTIAELRAEIDLFNSSSVPGAFHAAPPPPKTPLKPAKPIFTTNYYASESKHDVSKKETEDFRERLMAWKGWQVDMTPWNGTGGSKKVAF